MDKRGPMDDTIVPIRLRENVTVLVQGLPADLSLAEAAKIAAVIKAFASPQILAPEESEG